MSKEAVVHAAQAAPPTAVTGLTLCGVALSDWVLVATLVYTVFMILNGALTLRDKLRGKKHGD